MTLAGYLLIFSGFLFVIMIRDAASLDGMEVEKILGIQFTANSFIFFFLAGLAMLPFGM